MCLVEFRRFLIFAKIGPVLSPEVWSPYVLKSPSLKPWNAEVLKSCIPESKNPWIPEVMNLESWIGEGFAPHLLRQQECPKLELESSKNTEWTQYQFYLSCLLCPPFVLWGGFNAEVSPNFGEFSSKIEIFQKLPGSIQECSGII